MDWCVTSSGDAGRCVSSQGHVTSSGDVGRCVSSPGGMANVLLCFVELSWSSDSPSPSPQGQGTSFQVSYANSDLAY